MRALRAVGVVVLTVAGLMTSGSLRAEAYLCVGPHGQGLPGDATAPGYEGCIEVIGFAERLSVEQLPPGGGVPAREFGPITIVKRIDRATPLLMHNAASGTPLVETTLTFLREIAGNAAPYYIITLSNVVLVVNTSATAGTGIPTEQISLSFTRIQWEYKLYNEAGQLDDTISENWDVVTDGSF